MKNRVLGECVGIELSESEGGYCFRLLLEDDENWERTDFNIHVHWLDDLIEVCEMAKIKLKKLE